MIAYDPRRPPDPARFLQPETIEVLRSAFEEQRLAGDEPLESLASAIRVAACEAREKNLQPEALILQLKAVADAVGLPPTDPARERRHQAREWMVRACLLAYWSPDRPEAR